MQLAQRPTLELSGPRLKLALEALIERAEDLGGVEAYVQALAAKSALFRAALDAELELKQFRSLCAHMATVRRRIGRYAQPESFPWVREQIRALFRNRGDSSTTEAGIAALSAA